jgi:hypothetical protein
MQMAHSCGGCGEEFDPSDQVGLIQVVRPYRIFDQTSQQWVLHFEKILDEDGDFTHAPYFFHKKCWEETERSLLEYMEDLDPIKVDKNKHNVACICSCCSSEVAEGEELGVIHDGQFELSAYQPNLSDVLDVAFHSYPDYLCTTCLNELNVSLIELWDEESGIKEDAIERERERRKQPWVSV